MIESDKVIEDNILSVDEAQPVMAIQHANDEFHCKVDGRHSPLLTRSIGPTSLSLDPFSTLNGSG